MSLCEEESRELYRLRLGAAAPLPTAGTLVYVETSPAPFTGQGFAADPETGGLVGIDRKRREILLATAITGSAGDAAGPPGN